MRSTFVCWWLLVLKFSIRASGDVIENIVTFYVDSNPDNTSLSVLKDHSTDTCVTTSHYSFPWIVMDMQLRFDVSKIEITSESKKALAFHGHQVYIGDKPWRPCANYAIFQNFKLCNTISIDPNDVPSKLSIDCQGTGQFVAIVATQTQTANLGICEIVIVGTPAKITYFPKKRRNEPRYLHACTNISNTEINVAYGRPALQSSISYDLGPNLMTDGVIKGHNKFIYTHSDGRHWAMVDLGSTFDVSFVRLWLDIGRSTFVDGYEIAVGNDFRACLPQIFLDEWRTCAVIKSFAAIPMVEQPCLGIGRYVIIRAPKEMKVSLVFTEFEVFGNPSSEELQSSTPDYKLACSVTKSEQNLAYKSFAFQSSVLYSLDGMALTDGVSGKGECSYTVYKGTHWAVVDLRAESAIQFVRIWAKPSEVHNLNGYQIAVGNSFKFCSPHTTIFQYTPCANITNMKDQELIELDCIATGRYVAIRAPGPQTESMAMSEIEVFGTKLTENQPPSNDYQSRCTVTTNEENLAYLKPVKISSDESNKERITDGKLSRSYTSEISSHEWIVVDMKSVKSVEYIRMWIDIDDHTARHVEVLVGKQFLPCEAHLLNTFTRCGVFETSKKIKLVENKCAENIEGQFVLVRYGKPGDDTTQPARISFEEIEVFGSKPESDEESMSVPTIDLKVKNVDVNQWTAVRRAILAGVSTVDLPKFAGMVLFGKSNSYSIIFNKEEDTSYMVATFLGTGRLITMGSRDHFHTLRKQNETSVLWKNMIKWLRNGNSLRGNIVDVEKGYQPGDIVYIADTVDVSQEQMQTLINQLSEGQIGVIHAIAGWQVQHTTLDKLTQYALNEAAGVYFSSQIFSWSATTWKINPLDDITTISAEILLKEAIDQPGLLADNVHKLRGLREMNQNILMKFSLRPLVLQLVDKYRDFVKYHQPCIANQLQDKEIQPFILAYNLLLLLPFYDGMKVKAPGIYNFPGDFETVPKVEEKKLKFIAQFEEDLPTGIYVPAGETLQFTVNSLVNSKLDDWRFRIGCHTDDLSRKDSWKRFPIVTGVHRLSRNSTHSPFGGLLMLQSKKANSSITITFRNAVNALFFNLRDPSDVKKYDSRRASAVAPWADLAGDSIILCFPTKKVKSYSMEYVKNLMQNVWDKVVQWDNDLLDRDYHTRRRQRVSMDIQVSAGDAHSGYPIVIPFSWFPGAFNVTSILKEGSWGMFHELGHNHQDSAWTYKGAGEITVNIFSLFNQEQFLNLPIVASRHPYFFSERSKSFLIKHLDNGATFESFVDDPFIGLTLYLQLSHCFGWGLYKNVFSQYNLRHLKPKTDQDKMDEWFIQVSLQVKLNVKPIFEYWGFPVTENASKYVSKFPCILPTEDLSFSSSRWKWINDKYENRCSGKCFKVPYPTPQPMDVMSPNHIYEE